MQADGAARWFAPVLRRLDSLGDFFDPDLPLLVGRAPGRLDVMGGIADYSGALVLELPLARATFAVLQGRDAPRMDIRSLRGGDEHRFSMELGALRRSPAELAAWFSAHPADRWAAYIVGVAHACMARLPEPAVRGFRLWIESEVPEGKGVSSSAALEVACMMAMAAHWNVPMTVPELAAACQWAENHVAGAPCGIMDQMTSACGRQDHLLRLRCQPGTVEGQVPVPGGFRFWGIDSGIRHAVTGADYGTVRTAAFMGLRMLEHAAGGDPGWGGYLANLAPAEFAGLAAALPDTLRGDEFLRRFGGIADPATRVQPEREYPVRAATAHPVHEQARVARFAALLARLPAEPELAPEMGRLMAESHASYSACGLGSDGTDRLVEMVREAGGELFGAKITGGGSGGTVAVFGRAAADREVHAIAARYAAETGRAAEVFARSGPGAAEIGLLALSAWQRDT